MNQVSVSFLRHSSKQQLHQAKLYQTHTATKMCDSFKPNLLFSACNMNFPIFTYSFIFPSLNLLLPSAELEFVQSRPQESDFRGKFAPSQNNILMGSSHWERSYHWQVYPPSPTNNDLTYILGYLLAVHIACTCKSDIFAKKLQIILIYLKFVLWSLNGLIFVLRTSGKSYWSVWLAWITMAEVQKPIELWNQKIVYKTCITIHLYLGISSYFYKSWGNMSGIMKVQRI